MTQSKTNELPKSNPLHPGRYGDWGKTQPFPFRRWLDLMDTERFGQKTYINKRYRQPHVYVGVDDKEIGLELLNYFTFNASLGPPVPFIQGDIIDIFQSFDLPSPFPPLTLNERDLSPVTYDGLGKLTVKQAGLYACMMDFQLTLEQNIAKVEVFFESTTRGVLFKWEQGVSGKEITIPGLIVDNELKDGTLVDGVVVATGDDVEGDVEGTIPPEVESKYTFEDLSDFFSTISGNKNRDIYINENEVVFVRFLITPAVAGDPIGSIDDATFSLSFLRPNW